MDVALFINRIAVSVNCDLGLTVCVRTIRQDLDCGRVSVLIVKDFVAVTVYIVGIDYLAVLVNRELNVFAESEAIRSVLLVITVSRITGQLIFHHVGSTV